MSFVASSNDTGYYTGRLNDILLPATNLSSSNLLYPANQHVWFVLKSALKSSGKWQVAAWGSGSSTGTYSDPFTTNLSLATDGCWFIISETTNSRSFCIQKNTSSLNNFAATPNFYSDSVRIKYSPTGFAITGTLSPVVTPGPIFAGQELVIYGDGTDASPGFDNTFFINTSPFTTNFRTRFSVYVKNQGQNGFYVYYKQQGNAKATFFCLDPLVEPYSGDPDPYVVLAHTSLVSSTPLSINFLYGNGRRNFGFVGLSNTSAFVSGSIFHASNNKLREGANGTTINRNGFITPYGEDIVALPLMYIASASNIITGSYKGWSTFLKSNSISALDDGSSVLGYPHGTETFSFYSKNDALLIGSCFVPWFGTEVEES